MKLSRRRCFVYKTWTGVPVRGPLHGPGPWTTLNFQKEIAPVNMKIYRRSGYEKHRLVFCAYVLKGLSRKSGLLWDRAPINGKTTNSFWDTGDLVNFYIFIPTLSNYNSIRNSPSPVYCTLSCIKISRSIL